MRAFRFASRGHGGARDRRPVRRQAARVKLYRHPGRALGFACQKRRAPTLASRFAASKERLADATGTLNLKGVLHIVLGKRSAAMKSVTCTCPAKGSGKVTVKLAGHKVGLLTVTGKVHVKQSGTI
jgi:hypothetical protein